MRFLELIKGLSCVLSFCLFLSFKAQGKGPLEVELKLEPLGNDLEIYALCKNESQTELFALLELEVTKQGKSGKSKVVQRKIIKLAPNETASPFLMRLKVYAEDRFWINLKAYDEEGKVILEKKFSSEGVI
jgi:hypothetical protein